MEHIYNKDTDDITVYHVFDNSKQYLPVEFKSNAIDKTYHYQLSLHYKVPEDKFRLNFNHKEQNKKVSQMVTE